MNILIAADKFKGSLTATEVCRAIKAGILESLVDAKCTLLPLADGGEGTLDVLEKVLHLKMVTSHVKDPLFRVISSSYGINGEEAYIEMARASGLELLSKNERSAAKTSSVGVGELIRHVVQNGASTVHLFVGGSASNDGGIGLASALGFKFLDQKGEELMPMGMNLSKIQSIVNERFLKGIHINLICDVANPLLGPNGASHQYAKQKGASEEEIRMLEEGLEHLANLIHRLKGKDVSNMPGCGAAGGLGLSVLGLLNGSIKNGMQSILEIVNFREKLTGVDLVITGEGKLDSQTLQGKVVHGVSKISKDHDIPVLVICGDSELSSSQLEGAELKHVLKLKTEDLTIGYCIKNASDLIRIRVAEFLEKY